MCATQSGQSFPASGTNQVSATSAWSSFIRGHLLWLAAALAGVLGIACGVLTIGATPGPLHDVTTTPPLPQSTAPLVEDSPFEVRPSYRSDPFHSAEEYRGRQLRSQALERKEVLGGQSVELLRVDGQPGKVVSFNVILGSDPASKASLERSRLKIFVDGATEPVTDLELVDFFFTRGFPPGEGSPSRWLGDLVGVSSYVISSAGPPVTGRVGYYRFVDIPFQDSVLVELHNGDASNPVEVFSQVEYLTAPALASEAQQPSFQTAKVERAIMGPGATLDLLRLERGAGFVESIYLAAWEKPGESFHWPEMNLVARFGDETAPGYDSSGTEDFFLSSWGWSAGPSAQRFYGHPVHRQNGWNSQYRYFPTGLWFDDGVRLTWEPGAFDGPELTAGGDVAPIEVWAVVTYYLLDER